MSYGRFLKPARVDTALRASKANRDEYTAQQHATAAVLMNQASPAHQSIVGKSMICLRFFSLVSSMDTIVIDIAIVVP